MRLYAIVTAVLAAVTVLGLSGATAFAETNTNSKAVSATVTAIKYVTVKSGDNLSTIAASNNTTYVRLFDANEQIVNLNLIYPGEILTIPTVNEQLTNRPLYSNTVKQIVSTSGLEQDTNDNSPVAPAQSSVAPQVSAVTLGVPQQTTSVIVASGSIWDRLAQCESGGNWSIDTGNGFYGGLQFTLSSWEAVGGTGYPNQASRNEQIMRAKLLQQQQGWGAWPVCSVEVGL
jgi:LysM repeat protein